MVMMITTLMMTTIIVKIPIMIAYHAMIV